MNRMMSKCAVCGGPLQQRLTNEGKVMACSVCFRPVGFLAEPVVALKEPMTAVRLNTRFGGVEGQMTQRTSEGIITMLAGGLLALLGVFAVLFCSNKAKPA